MTSVSFISLPHPPPIKFYFLTTKYFQIIYFICSSIVWQSVSRSYCRYHSLWHSPPQQNFRQLFFSFRKVWGYPTALISWFINFKTSRLRDCAYSFFKQISKISDKNLPDDEMKALKNLIENKIINA